MNGLFFYTLVCGIVLGVLVIVHEFGHFIAAKKLGVRVERFSFGFGPRLLKKRKGDTEYTISAIPLGGYVKLAGDTLDECKGRPDEYFSRPAGARAAIVLCGPLLNYLTGIIFLWAVFFVGSPEQTTMVGGLLDGFGAKDAGVQVGDRIVSIDDVRVRLFDELQQIVQRKKVSSIVKLEVMRNGRTIPLEALIKEKPGADTKGRHAASGLLGVSPSKESVTIRYGLFESFQLSVRKAWEYTAMTYMALGRIITGKLPVRDSITGPVGIFYLISKVATLGIMPLVHLAALLSISLAIFNLLPVPVLDGGHLLFLAVEKVRGKALGKKAEEVLSQVGLTLIIALALTATYNDIVRFFGEQIAKFFK